MNLKTAYDQIQAEIEVREQRQRELREQATTVLEGGSRRVWEQLTYLAHLEGCKVQGLQQAKTVVYCCMLEEKNQGRGGQDGTL